tara:strand:- start:133 stop:438 length:306 start_codon:yes stop_codon:yes gene_type:complete
LDVIGDLSDEIDSKNTKGNSYDKAYAISLQLPFFACSNVLLDQECQDDIERYIYSKRFSMPPYRGSYGDQPKKWVYKSFIINNALEVKKYQEQKKAQKGVK